MNWQGLAPSSRAESRATGEVFCHSSSGAMGLVLGRAGALLQLSDQQGPCRADTEPGHVSHSSKSLAAVRVFQWEINKSSNLSHHLKLWCQG